MSDYGKTIDPQEDREQVLRDALEKVIQKTGGNLVDDIRKAVREYQDWGQGPLSWMVPATRAEVIREIKAKPAALETSYTVNGEQLLIQSGALSIVAAPTGHGKTTLLINLLLDAVKRYPDRRHWLFSYEEDRTAVMIKTLNAYCNQEYSRNNKSTIQSYYAKGTDKYFSHNAEGFKEREKDFWRLVESGRLNIIPCGYRDYYSEKLMQFLAALSDDRPGFIGIDYLQLLYSETRDKYTARTEELKRICLDMKDLAVEKKLSILAAAQFNRTVQFPMHMESQSIADAADIERAANKIIGLWNGHFQPAETNDKTSKAGKSHMRDKGIEPDTIYLEILKARDERAGGWGVYPFDGNLGVIGSEKGTPHIDTEALERNAGTSNGKQESSGQNVKSPSPYASPEDWGSQ